MSVQVSVVVPTFDRPDLLRTCLTALARQDYLAEAYEVIVVDNAGTEKTRLLVEEYAAGNGITDAGRDAPRVSGRHASFYYLLAADKPGPAAARNAGWRFAHGDVVAFTDDDCVPEAGWIRAGLEALEIGYDAVNGSVEVPIPARPTDYERNTARLATAEFLTANCFVRCSALEASGGFDERFETAWREDSDLQFTLLEQGCHIGRAQAAVVVHPVRRAPWGVSLKEQRKSMYNALLFKKHPRLYRQRIQSGPPWRNYVIVLSALGAAAAAILGQRVPALLMAFLWGMVTSSFMSGRLQGTIHSLRHIGEMAVTSILIPPLSVFWRLYGAVKYRVWFC